MDGRSAVRRCGFRGPWLALSSLLVAALCGTIPALAQSGGIRIQVVDAGDRSALPGATVTLANTQRLVAPSQVLSDADGLAEFPVLRAGAGYEITVSLPGFATQRRQGLRVLSGKTLAFDVLLGHSLEERVSVVGSSRVVDLDQVGGSSKFSDDFIEDLPAPGRFYQDILTLAPGVKDEDGDGNPNVHGARSRNFRAEVSGVSNVDPLTGLWLSRVNADSIEELEIIQQGAGAEFGRAQGGFARVIQKQGTNQLEGVFNFLWRTSELDGDGAGRSTPASPTPKFETIQPSLQVSGPIVRDRLWYRLSHESIRREDPVNLVGRIAVKTRRQELHSDQLTFQASPRNKLSLQYQSDPLNLDNLGISSTVPETSSRTLDTGGDTFTLSWLAPYSARMLAETLVSYQDVKQDVIPTTTGVSQECLGFFYIADMNDARCFDLETSRVSGSHHESSRDRRQRLTFKTQATLYRRLWGQSHRLKVGMTVENERYFRRLLRGPDITFSIETPAVGNPVAQAFTTMAIPRSSRARAVGNSVGFFVEDQWKPLSSLSVTLGGRIDVEEIDSLGAQPFDPTAEFELFDQRVDAGQQLTSIFLNTFTAYEDIEGFQDELAETLAIPPSLVRLDPVTIQSGFWRNPRRARNIHLTNTNLSPRVSVAWDPGGAGKTKLSATAGRYYDKIFLAVPLVELDPIETTIQFEGLLVDGGFLNVDNDISTSPLSARMVDRDLRTPYQDEFSFSIERELWPETSVRATYLRRDFRDQLQDVDINHGPGDLGRCKIPQQPGDRLVVVSEESGFPIVDPYTGLVYEDTDPGRGDGLIDDCTGNVIQVGGTLGSQVAVPDGLPDLYVRNPGWRELLLLGNFNRSDYEAVIVEFVRRLYRSWELQANYTWSQARGDAEDFDLLLGNEQNLRDDEAGFLDFDQRHYAQLSATSLTPWGWRAGMVLSWQSGLPYSVLQSRLTVFATPPLFFDQGPREQRPRLRYPTGRRNDQRNSGFWNLDLRLARDFRLSRVGEAQLSFEAFNLLNDDTLRIESQVNGVIEGSKRFGRQFQVGLKLHF